MVLAELDYLLTSRIGAAAAMNALDFIAGQAESRRFEIPDTAPHLRTAMAVVRGYVDADGGAGVGLTDAMTVALATAFQRADIFTTDGLPHDAAAHWSARLPASSRRSLTVGDTLESCGLSTAAGCPVVNSRSRRGPDRTKVMRAHGGAARFTSVNCPRA
ncbi:hypothetical protein PV379_07855 [Streptomyces caniscabiei]|uniref:hypothetical protein n=1 Tax=Streptomyces caniscabiei TaxID=2746961 RepID=UPI0029B6FDA9|nr:hypothetical protein [Streptomyces caniscabiei]MDX2602730.1 hypothetical protein [Streptomyces caniscabiei]MDX2737983.1 hypothetical protein [Streptomyces caniscabiei]MDX2777229.1 hypothetical protein [Streptomyces caniscabiei]